MGWLQSNNLTSHDIHRETVCFIVGSFGVVPLAVHSIAYNVIPVVFMGAVGLATGLTVRIGNELSGNVARAKRIAKWCMGLAIVSGLIMSFLLYRFRVSVIGLFTNDDVVMQVSSV
jgi:Na+-driven multidrug efflux pump